MVREAVAGDRELVCGMLDLLAAYQRKPWETGTPEQQLAVHDHALVLEDDGGFVVGCALASAGGTISGVWVDADQRRRGGATRLVRAAEDWLRGQGRNAAEVTVLDDNHGAVALYRGLGYRYDRPDPSGLASVFRRDLGEIGFSGGPGLQGGEA